MAEDVNLAQVAQDLPGLSGEPPCLSSDPASFGSIVWLQPVRAFRG